MAGFPSGLPAFSFYGRCRKWLEMGLGGRGYAPFEHLSGRPISQLAHERLEAFLARLHVALGGTDVLVARRFPYFMNLAALISAETYELVSEIVPRQSALTADRQARMTNRSRQLLSKLAT
jgi:hypothetical protein